MNYFHVPCVQAPVQLISQLSNSGGTTTTASDFPGVYCEKIDIALNFWRLVFLDFSTIYMPQVWAAPFPWIKLTFLFEGTHFHQPSDKPGVLHLCCTHFNGDKQMSFQINLFSKVLCIQVPIQFLVFNCQFLFIQFSLSLVVIHDYPA